MDAHLLAGTDAGYYFPGGASLLEELRELVAVPLPARYRYRIADSKRERFPLLSAICLGRAARAIL